MMEKYIIKILHETFSKNYGLQLVLKSEDKLVATQALGMLSMFTSLGKTYLDKNLDEIIKLTV